MNIEELEKLNSLKDKGIITQKEFDEQKKKILGNKSTPQEASKTKINWRNVGISFLYALGSVLVTSVIATIIMYAYSDLSEKTSTILGRIIYVIWAIIISVIAYKYETKKYKKNAPAWAIFIGVALFQALGVWVASYDLLQIKSGLKELKPENRDKQEKE